MQRLQYFVFFVFFVFFFFFFLANLILQSAEEQFNPGGKVSLLNVTVNHAGRNLLCEEGRACSTFVFCFDLYFLRLASQPLQLVETRYVVINSEQF